MENKQNGIGDTQSIPPKMLDSVSMTTINYLTERPVIKFCTENDRTALNSTGITSSRPTVN